MAEKDVRNFGAKGMPNQTATNMEIHWAKSDYLMDLLLGSGH
jgi:hypothetical protein